MKLHEFFYIVAVFLIIGSIAIYQLSLVITLDMSTNSLSNLMGETIPYDSTIAIGEAIVQFQEQERNKNRLLLYLAIPLGILMFSAGLIIKRKKEGPDLFIDGDDIDDL